MIDAAFSRLLNSPQWTQQFVAVAILLLLALWGAGLASAVVGHLQWQSAYIQSLRQQGGILEAVIAQRPYLNTVSVEGGLQSSLFGQTLQGENSSIARAALQSRFSALAQGHQVEVVSVGNARDLDIGGLTYLGLAVSLQGPMREVHATVMDLETSAPQLFLQDVVFHAVNAPRGNDAVGAQATQLTLQCKIYGLFIAGTGGDFAPGSAASEPVAGQ